MAKSKTNRIILVAIGLLVLTNVVLMGFSLSVFKSQTQANSIPKNLPATDNINALSLDGFVKADIELTPTALVVKNGCKGIPMTPTEQQLRSIQSALMNQTDARPSTHDLMKDIFETFGIQVLQSKIVDADDTENIYYARLIVKQGDKVLNLDAKPSDAMAVSLRANLPFYIKKDILDRKGKDVCSAKT